MKKKNLLSLFITLGIILSLFACTTPTETVAPSPTNTQESPTETATTAPTSTATPDPNLVSTEIGPEGGSLISSDGLVELTFPPEALTVVTTVSIRTLVSEGEEEWFLTPGYDITFSPELEEPLSLPAWLTLLTPVEIDNPDALIYTRWTQVEATIEAVDGDVPDEVEYWRTLEYTRLTEGDLPTLPMFTFSRFRLFNMDLGPDCIPPAEMLEYPGDLEGYIYRGVEVIINSVYSREYSTLPEGYHLEYSGKVRTTRLVDEEHGCDILIMHWYVPDPDDDGGNGDGDDGNGGGGGGGQPPGLQPPIQPPHIPCWVHMGTIWVYKGRVVQDLMDMWAVDPFEDVPMKWRKGDWMAVFFYSPIDCDDGNPCTDDFCFLDECYHDPIPGCHTPTPYSPSASCKCGPGCTLVASAACTWSDKTQCSGFASACHHEGVNTNQALPSGTTCCWGDCCITMYCP